MELSEANEAYAHPNGHTKAELHECLDVLNEAAQPIELGDIQFKAIVDAHRRLNHAK